MERQRPEDRGSKAVKSDRDRETDPQGPGAEKQQGRGVGRGRGGVAGVAGREGIQAGREHPRRLLWREGAAWALQVRSVAGMGPAAVPAATLPGAHPAPKPSALLAPPSK